MFSLQVVMAEKFPYIAQACAADFVFLANNFLAQHDLSFKEFKHCWKRNSMSCLHYSCPKVMKKSEYLQILYSCLLSFLNLPLYFKDDLNKIELIPSLQGLKTFEAIQATWNIAILYSLFSLYETQLEPKSIPIRIDDEKLAEVLLSLDKIKLLGDIGEDAIIIAAIMIKRGTFVACSVSFKFDATSTLGQDHRLRQFRLELSSKVQDGKAKIIEIISSINSDVAEDNGASLQSEVASVFSCCKESSGGRSQEEQVDNVSVQPARRNENSSQGGLSTSELSISDRRQLQTMKYALMKENSEKSAHQKQEKETKGNRLRELKEIPRWNPSKRKSDRRINQLSSRLNTPTPSLSSLKSDRRKSKPTSKPLVGHSEQTPLTPNCGQRINLRSSCVATTFESNSDSDDEEENYKSATTHGDNVNDHPSSSCNMLAILADLESQTNSILENDDCRRKNTVAPMVGLATKEKRKNRTDDVEFVADLVVGKMKRRRRPACAVTLTGSTAGSGGIRGHNKGGDAKPMSSGKATSRSNRATSNHTSLSERAHEYSSSLHAGDRRKTRSSVLMALKSIESSFD